MKTLSPDGNVQSDLRLAWQWEHLEDPGRFRHPQVGGKQEDLLLPVESDHCPLVRLKDDHLGLEWNATAAGYRPLRDESQGHNGDKCEFVHFILLQLGTC